MIEEYLVTKRGIVDLGDPCNVNCVFCFHTGSNNKFVPLDTLKRLLDKLKANTREYFTITGGAPTIYPDIIELIKYGVSLGLKGQMITHDLTRAQEFIDAGLTSFLVSLHGIGKVHDSILQKDGYFDIQVKGLRWLDKNNIPYGINTVICKQSYQTLPELARFLLSYNPKSINYINFIPVDEWKVNDIPITDVCVSPDQSKSFLIRAINILSSKECVINVRYYPVCSLMTYEKHVVNATNYQFDPNEWCNEIKSPEEVIKNGWEKALERNVLLESCKMCSIKRVCGGVDKRVVKEIGPINITPYIFEEEVKDVLYFRRGYKEAFNYF